MTTPSIPLPKPPAHVAPYVEVLGPEMTIALLLEFGGAPLHLSADPKGKSRLEQLVGYEKAKALASISDRLQQRVPLAKPWIADCLRAKGDSVAEIARTLRCTDVSVRKWLKNGYPGQGRPE